MAGEEPSDRLSNPKRSALRTHTATPTGLVDFIYTLCATPMATEEEVWLRRGRWRMGRAPEPWGRMGNGWVVNRATGRRFAKETEAFNLNF